MVFEALCYLILKYLNIKVSQNTASKMLLFKRTLLIKKIKKTSDSELRKELQDYESDLEKFAQDHGYYFSSEQFYKKFNALRMRYDALLASGTNMTKKQIQLLEKTKKELVILLEIAHNQ